MSPLPYVDVVTALRTAGSRAGVIREHGLSRALASTPEVDDATAALTFARLAAGPAVDALTAREIGLDLATLPSPARSLARVVAPALASLSDEAKVVQLALFGIVGATSAIFGAVVPWAPAVDATLLQACRDAGFGSDQLAAHKDRSRELARRIARALGVPVVGRQGVEEASVSARKLEELDATRAEAEARRRAIEQSIRSKLPRL